MGWQYDGLHSRLQTVGADEDGRLSATCVDGRPSLVPGHITTHIAARPQLNQLLHRTILHDRTTLETTEMPVAFPLLHSHLLLRRLIAQNPATGPAHHFIYLLGETTQVRHDTDRELPFRQESNFAWLTGCEVPGAAVTISCEYQGGELDESTVETRLYLPEVDPDEVM